jgi:pantothenate kinase
MNEEYNGAERRSGWERQELKVLGDIQSIKEEVKDVKKSMSDLQLTTVKMGIEVQQMVNESATRTSTKISLIVGIAIAVASGLIMIYITGKPQ